VSALGEAVVVVVVGVVVVVVDEGVVVVVVVAGAGVVEAAVVVVDPVGVDAVGGALEEVEVVELPLDEDDDVVVLSVVEELGLEEVVIKPLLCSCVSISCWTAATAEATAAGVASDPSSGSASSCLRSAASCAASSLDGCDLSVTTIWSAMAVVRHAVQL
jgi:hypothetical protein